MKVTNERIAFTVTVLILLALPISLLAYKRVYLPHKFSGARIITLTAIATDGVWTQEQVRGINYWRKHFSPTPEIQVGLGETIVLRLASADVLHTFAIPALDIGPIDVPAGEVREIKFIVNQPGTLVFLCWQVCSPNHGKLNGKIVVLGPDGKPAEQTTEEEPNLDGESAPQDSGQQPDLDNDRSQQPELEEHAHHDN
jgi:cytochrome c oxidase subunit II